MKFIGLRNMCSPAMVYLTLSITSIIILMLTNYGNQKLKCLGNLSCNADMTYVVVIKVIYILFWTWILNIICKSGAEQLAWFLVLFPFILFMMLVMYL